MIWPAAGSMHQFNIENVDDATPRMWASQLLSTINEENNYTRTSIPAHASPRHIELLESLDRDVRYQAIEQSIESGQAALDDVLASAYASTAATTTPGAIPMQMSVPVPVPVLIPDEDEVLLATPIPTRPMPQFLMRPTTPAAQYQYLRSEFQFEAEQEEDEVETPDLHYTPSNQNAGSCSRSRPQPQPQDQSLTAAELLASFSTKRARF
jgi:hypothetical protein